MVVFIWKKDGKEYTNKTATRDQDYFMIDKDRTPKEQDKKDE